MILIDLQKAFDTVNHDILLKKMEFIGLSEETIKWIFFTKNCPNCFDEIYLPLETNGVHTRSSY